MITAAYVIMFVYVLDNTFSAIPSFEAATHDYCLKNSRKVSLVTSSVIETNLGHVVNLLNTALLRVNSKELVVLDDILCNGLCIVY